MSANKANLRALTGLEFAAPKTHSPWRNYSRSLKLCLLISKIQQKTQPTPVAQMLSQPGLVTCDEYLHFLIQASTKPSPALQEWRPDATFRYPLLFALKYLLAKAAISIGAVATIDEIIGAYKQTGFDGTESQDQFIATVTAEIDYAAIGRTSNPTLRRQARESLLVISQISYLHVDDYTITVSLHPKDAGSIFEDLRPINGSRENDPDAEILRLASLFQDGMADINFDFPQTSMDDVAESGFCEGSKVKKTHVVIERNVALREQFFCGSSDVHLRCLPDRNRKSILMDRTSLGHTSPSSTFIGY